MQNEKEFMSEKSEHQIILAEHNTCCLCGSRLVFKHQVDFLLMQVQEEAHCPSCKIRLKSKEHSVH